MRWFGSNKSNDTERSPGGKLSLPAFVARNIASIADLDGPHFVFLVTFTNGDQMVLKAEMSVNSSQTVSSHNIGVRVMGLVSPVKAVTLTDAEKAQVGIVDTGISSAFFKAEQAIAAGNAHWVKAVFQTGLAGLKDAGSFQVKAEGSMFGDDDPQKKIAATAYMAKLNRQLAGNSKAWKSLGAIVAVDMLLGNQDRISLHNAGFDNLPNVQFRQNGNKITEAVGLDTYDSLHTGTSDLHDISIDDWKTNCGEYLKDLNKAETQIGAAMNDGIRQINKTFGTGTCTWGTKEKKAFAEGYKSSAAKLKTKMKAEAPKLMKLGGSAPKGLLLRLNWLGWL